MNLKNWTKLIIGFALPIVMAGVIIWALLTLYQPTFSAVEDRADGRDAVGLRTG